MGVVGTVIGTLGTAFLSGRAQQQQYEAQAAQAKANARIQQQNAEISRQNSERARQNAEEAARNSAMNAENERRKALLREGQQRARIGASGIQATGSAAAALSDTRYAINQDTAKALYNGRQNVDKIFGQATDYTNQASQYQYNADVLNANAKDYRKAGERAKMTSLLGGVFSLAGNLYTQNSAAAKAAETSGASSPGLLGDYKSGVSMTNWEANNDWLNYKKTGNFAYNDRWNTATPSYAKPKRFF